MDKRLIGVAVTIDTKAMQVWMEGMLEKEKFDGQDEILITIDESAYAMTFKELKERLEK